MRTALAAALARNVRVASIAVAAAVLGASGAAATVATVADTTPSAGPSAEASAEASAGHPSDEADDADEPAGTETSKPKAAKESAKPKHGASTVPAAPVDPAACAAALHHGDYVAQVAAATEGKADRGALVSAAARSDCGKPTRATGAADGAEHGADGPGTSAEHRAAPHGKSAEHAAK